MATRKNLKRKFSILMLFLIYTLYQNIHTTKMLHTNQMKTIKIQNNNAILLSNISNEVSFAQQNNHFDQYQLNKNLNHSFKTYLPNKRNLENKKGYYLLLEYTKVFGNTKYCQMQIDTNNFKSYPNLLNETKTSERYDLLDKCKFKNCFFTCNKTLANQADALIFHDITSLELDFKRENSQIFIYWNDEANRVDKNYDSFNFNWTLSYKYESEASYCAYGCFTNQSKINRKNFKNDIKIEFLKRRNNSIWFVSNCFSESRINYTACLSLKSPITVYGNCRDKIQSFLKPNNRLTFSTNDCQRDSKCELDELNQNKFFLAFESKNCSSYITEKFWRSLHYGIIPVVFQPSKEFYDRIVFFEKALPKKTFYFFFKFFIQFKINFLN